MTQPHTTQYRLTLQSISNRVIAPLSLFAPSDNAESFLSFFIFHSEIMLRVETINRLLGSSVG